MPTKFFIIFNGIMMCCWVGIFTYRLGDGSLNHLSATAYTGLFVLSLCTALMNLGDCKCK